MKPGRPRKDAALPEDASELRRWRVRHGMTQRDAADALGIAPRNLARYDSGQMPINRMMALAMAGHETRALLLDLGGALAPLVIDNRADAAVLAPLLPYLTDAEIVQEGALTPIPAAVAACEGWGTFWNDRRQAVEIQTDQARGIFATDQAALTHVKKRARSGSRLHKLALHCCVSAATAA